MAQTLEGIEFYLLELKPADGSTPERLFEDAVRGLVRQGDGFIVWNDRIFIAVVTDPSGAGGAARRLKKLMAEFGQPAKVSLHSEPFVDAVIGVVSKIQAHEIDVRPRNLHFDKETPE